MKFKDFGISNSLLWFLISVFLFFWLGEQLINAIINLEILNIRTTDIVTYQDVPIWFILVCILKFTFWLFSVAVAFKYVQSKLGNKST
mgnify:CR=1 FL=1